MLQHILAQRDLTFGGDRERAHHRPQAGTIM
jgi:hypothetical protein